MKHRGVQALAYVILSLGILSVWTTFAKTEKIYRPEESRASGSSLVQSIQDEASDPFVASGSSLVQSIQGKARAPSVKRRLLPDTAWALSRLVPESVWDSLARSLEGSSRWQRAIQIYLGSVLRWQPEHYPLLFSGYFLIWLSTLGFLYQAKELTRTLYDVSEAGAMLCGALLGIALLGGNGIWADYPYDIPNAFVFTLALNALIRGRWWLPLAFAAAAYSKETSFLLIEAYVLLRWERWRRPGFWLVLGLLVLIFMLVRQWINMR